MSLLRALSPLKNTASLRHFAAAAAGKAPVNVAVTGAAGAIGYALLFRIASGAMLGKDQPVNLQLLELPQAQKAVTGVLMELEDCAFPLLHSIKVTDDANVAFKDAHYALLVGSKPRGPGMERKDLLQQNGVIFTAQGKALNDNADRGVKVIVVGNPANTNALILQSNAPDLDKKNITAMTRLDENRAVSQVANKTGTLVSDVERVVIWGNHSATQYPDVTNATVKGQAATAAIGDAAWIEKTFIPDVQQRGAAIINARGASSAASAANAAIDHMRDWALGTDGRVVSMAIPSDGSYGIPEGVVYSYPVVCTPGKYEIVQGLEVTDFSRGKMDATLKELQEERAAVESQLGPA